VGTLQVLVGFAEFLHMLEMARFERMFHILDNHRVQADDAFRRAQQCFTQFRRYRHGDMFVFGNGRDFAAVKIAIVKDILHGKHVFLLGLAR